MKIEVRKYTKELIQDVIDFEERLRKEENFWGWEIDEAYIESVKRSFDDNEFNASISLLAYVEDKVVGRIDSSMIASHFDGSKKHIWIGFVLSKVIGILGWLKDYFRSCFNVYRKKISKH